MSAFFTQELLGGDDKLREAFTCGQEKEWSVSRKAEESQL